MNKDKRIRLFNINIKDQALGVFTVPLRWAISKKCQSLSTGDTKLFFNYVSIWNIQGRRLCNPHEFCLGMSLKLHELDDWVEKMVDLEILKPDHDGVFSPFEDYFRCRLLDGEEARKRKAAAARGRNLKPAIDSMDSYCRRAVRVIKYLNFKSGKKWAIKNGVDAYSPLVERVANIIADGIEDGRNMRARIDAIAKGCTDPREREYKLRPSYIFPEDFGTGLKQISHPSQYSRLYSMLTLLDTKKPAGKAMSEVQNPSMGCSKGKLEPIRGGAYLFLRKKRENFSCKLSIQ